MSDFLRNLRSSHKKDVPLPRKSIDSNYYQNDRRTINDRRNSTNFTNNKALETQLGDALPEILENITTLTEQVAKIADTSQLLAESKIRKNNAVADFFNTLNKMVSEDKKTDIQRERPGKITTSYTSGTHYTKDDILSIIHNMRNQGATFSIIADHLKKQGMPTFSGRGEWHAQTIHRLCK